MAAAKKGKKTSKPKSGSKKKKTNNNMNFFMKFMLVLLLLAVLAGAVFYTLKNFNAADSGQRSAVSGQQSAVSGQQSNDKGLMANDERQKANDERQKAKGEGQRANDEGQKANVESKKPEAKSQQPTVNSQTKVNAEEKTAVLKQEVKESKTMSGSWQSSEQGAFLTMDKYGYRIDFANVHASKPITGSYFIENNLVTFTSDGDECYDSDGTYRITFYKKNISLTCKNDDCTDRKNILEADWEWLEY